MKHILDNSSRLIKTFNSITIFEKGKQMGFGMPYNPETTDIYNLSNISSEEIPKLPQSLASWLREQDQESLKKWNVTTFPIEDSQVYSRLALGHYFHAQFDVIIKKLKAEGFRVNALVNCTVTDILLEIKSNTGKVVANNGDYKCSKIVIATGHNFLNTDQPVTVIMEPRGLLKKFYLVNRNSIILRLAF
ncbi:FAD/NAD(P)-binding protein [Lacinutrix neustonica]|uniref:FAD/NAD(P)-binding protein n=1 Tax=Lacinutrix neustonica TaxID=2980107 RepID=A0A9E8SEF6_9FLAO|nr:FAD/NAD(P)-binding protein [Lacinutrix neustonica]WAC03156.1 FAD/NAD(P)-binding protein [Lacinutrix neustonica]